MNRINLPVRPGEPVVIPAVPNVKIEITRTVDGGFSLHVQSGPHPVEELCRTSTNGHQLLGSARSLAAGLKAGISIEQFRADAEGFHVTAPARPALDAALAEHAADPRTVRADETIEALRALSSEHGGTEDLAANIRADMKAGEAHERAERDRLTAAVEAIMADGGGQKFRADTRARVMSEARRQQATVAVRGRCWSDLAEHDRANTRPHLTGRRAELSPEQARVMGYADQDGFIAAQAGICITTLQALALRAMGSLTTGGKGQRMFEVSGLHLNNAGRAWLAENSEGGGHESAQSSCPSGSLGSHRARVGRPGQVVTGGRDHLAGNPVRIALGCVIGPDDDQAQATLEGAIRKPSHVVGLADTLWREERRFMTTTIDAATRERLIVALTSADLHLVAGLGMKGDPGSGDRCTVAEINLVLTGVLSDGPHPCMSEVIRRWVINIQDAMPDEIRNSLAWRTDAVGIAGSAADYDTEARRVDMILDWMWERLGDPAVLAGPTPQARPTWEAMPRERTGRACAAAAYAADGAAQRAAQRAAYAAAYADAYAADGAADYAAGYAAEAAGYAAGYAAEAAGYAAGAGGGADGYWERADLPGLLARLIAA